MTSEPTPRRIKTQITTLKSADFGSSFGGQPPEQPNIPGIGLPPPTQQIQVPTEVRSTDAVVEIFVEPPPLAERVEKIAKHTGGRIRDLARSIAGACVEAYQAAADKLSYATSEDTFSNAREVTLAGVRAAAKHSARTTHASARALVRGYHLVRNAIDEGFAQALDDGDTLPPIPNKMHATLAIDTALRARATLTQAPVVELPGGTPITVYPKHEAPIGWVLAQGPGGEIGFLQVADLEPQTVVG